MLCENSTVVIFKVIFYTKTFTDEMGKKNNDKVDKNISTHITDQQFLKFSVHHLHLEDLSNHELMNS